MEEEQGTKAKRGNRNMAQEAAALGVVLPVAPQTAAELVEAWQIPPRDVAAVAANVHRQKLGTRETELVAYVPVAEFDFQQIAKEFGPGIYFLKGAGRYSKHVAKMAVSADYARNCGFGRLPDPPAPPPAQDQQAVRTLSRAAEAAALDPVDLLGAIERAVDRGLEQRLGAGAAARGMDPLALQQSQMEAVERQLDFIGRMEARVKASLGVAPAAPEEDFSMSSLIKSLAPLVPALLGSLRSPAAPAAPAPAAPTLPPPAAPAAPSENPAVKLIPHADLQAILPAVRMLAPFTGLLSGMAADPAASAEKLAAQLAGYVPPACYAPLVRLSELAQERGPEVLEILGPQFRSERWREILAALAALLQVEP